MGIPLPKLLRAHRNAYHERNLAPLVTRKGLAAWASLAQRPAMYRRATGLGMRMLGWMGRRRGRLRTLPFAGGWTASRDLPAPQGRTFQQLWSARGGRRA